MMKEMKIKSNDVIYGTLVKGYNHFKRVDLTLALYQEMKDEGITTNAVFYNSLICQLVNTKYISKAYNVTFESIDLKIKISS